LAVRHFLYVVVITAYSVKSFRLVTIKILNPLIERLYSTINRSK